MQTAAASSRGCLGGGREVARKSADNSHGETNNPCSAAAASYLRWGGNGYILVAYREGPCSPALDLVGEQSWGNYGVLCTLLTREIQE